MEHAGDGAKPAMVCTTVFDGVNQRCNGGQWSF
jgi:hypothetical protein